MPITDKHSVLSQVFLALSYLLHPAILMLATVSVYASHSYHRYGLIIRDVLILGGVGLAPGIGWIIYKKRQQHISHYHLFFKEERRPVLLVLLGGLTAALVLYALLNVPYPMIAGLAIAILGGIGITCITWKWKISFHAAVSMGCAMLLFPTLPTIAWVFLGLALLSGMARLPIKQHTVSEVVGGWMYGLGITVVLLNLFGLW